MKNCKYELNYNGSQITFSSEEELDSFIKNNPDVFNLVAAPDFRFSKNLVSDNVKLLEDTNERNKEALAAMKVTPSKYEAEESEESYTDGSMGILDFIKSSHITKSSMQFNIENWERSERTRLEDDYRDLPEQERIQTIDKKIQEKKDQFDQIRKLGKGIHQIAEDVFIEAHLDYSTYPDEIRKKINDENSPNIDIGLLTDEAILQIVKQMYKVKKEIISGKKISKIFIEPCIDFQDSSFKLRGKIDTIIIYEDNTADILDFKVSSKNYNSWDADKKETSDSQLIAYQILLENLGMSFDKVNLRVIPIQVSKSGDLYTKASVESKLVDPNFNVRSKILDILNINITTKPVTSKIGEDTISAISKMVGFDVFNAAYDEKSFEYAKNNLVEVNSNGSYSFSVIPGLRSEDGNPIRRIVRSTRQEIDEELRKYLIGLKESRSEYSERIINAFKSLKEETTGNLPLISKDQTLNIWVNNNFTKYKTDRNWKVVDNPDLQELGVIMFKNDYTKEMDFVSVTFDNIDLDMDLEYGNSILGHFYENSKTESSKSKLVANMGNIELLKLMYISNQLATGYTTGELKVVSLTPDSKSYTSDLGIREKLEKNYNILANTIGIPTNKVKQTDPYITVASLYSAIKSSTVIGEYFKANSINKESFTLPNDMELRELDKNDKIKRLKELRELLIENFYKYRLNSTEDYSILGYLFYQVQNSIANLGGYSIDYKNEVKFTENILGGDLRMAFKNKTFLNSTLLNTQDTIPIVSAIYDRIVEANSRIRTEFEAYKVLDRRHTDKFKNSSKGLRNNKFVNNSEVIYENLFDTSNPKELKFKDYRYDTSLNSDEKAYLEWYIASLNKYRYGMESLDEVEAEYGDRWREVPLMRAEMLSRIVNNKQSVSKAIKDTYGLDPTIDPRMSYGMDSAQTDFGKNGLIFDGIYNSFITSNNPESRKAMIESEGIESFERNLERIKDTYAYLYMRKSKLDPVIADVSSALCAYAWSAKLSNQEKANKPTIDYIVNFIKSSVLDMSLIDEESRDTMRVVSTMKSAASKLVLGANVLSMAKEGLVGWWTIYSNAVANSVDPSRFGIKEATKAYGIVWGDAFRQMRTITMGEHLNAQYGIANMSEQELPDRLNYYQGEVGRIDNMLFFTARAPDFLHRMTVFIAYMLKDGNYDAHHLVDNDHIEYNWKEDKRFSVYAKYKDSREEDIPKSELETFKDQRALYQSIKSQMIKEGALVTDWKTGNVRPMTDQDDLPKAYTNLEANKMIQESNSMFGYMDNTNKSLFFRKGVGIIIGQFQAYLSAKKNQYFLSPGPYKTGKWVDKIDPVTGKKLYRKYTDSGEMIETTEDTGMPIKEWQGGMMEGIFWSLGSMFNVFNLVSKTGRGQLSKAWNDPVKQRNFILFLGDLGGLAFFLLINAMLFGGLSKKDMSYTEQNISNVLQNASSEFNVWKVFTGQLDLGFTAWSVIAKFATSLYNVVFGDNNLPRAITSNVGMFRLFKPMIYDMFPLEE